MWKVRGKNTYIFFTFTRLYKALLGFTSLNGTSISPSGPLSRGTMLSGAAGEKKYCF
jgi:hypothetical protein